MSIKLYVEGGGDSKALKTACRKGFRLFIEKAGLRGRMPGIVACGSRQNVYDRFQTALASPDGTPVLLVDAEGPVTGSDRWAHLTTRDGWERPNDASDDQCHLMVQVMESWFLAEPAKLATFYGQHFKENALPGNSDLEQVSKQDVYQDLKRATRNTQKGPYSKGAHSFDILARLDPGLVEAASPHASRFLDTLRAGGPA